MKALKKILTSLLIIVMLLLVVSFFLPGKFSIEKEVIVKAPMSTVYDQVYNFKNVNNWGPWYEMDTTAQYTYEGTPGEVGSKMTWESNNPQVGKGQLVRESSEMSTSIVNKLVNLESGTEGVDKYTFEQLEEGQVKVTWNVEGTFGKMPWHKYMLLLFKPKMEEMFVNGLNNLKEYSENVAKDQADKPAKMMINGFDAELSQGEAFNVIGIRKVITMEELQDSTTFAENYAKMGAYCAANNITPVGPPAAIYYEFNEKENRVDVMFAFPVTDDVEAPAKDKEVQLATVPAGQLLTVTYVGPYDQSKATWDAIDVWLQDMGMDYAGAPWESYVSDPGNTPVNELVTKIIVPVAPAAEEVSMESITE